ncbi:MAG: Hsp20/alpha crystallin family protein [Bacteroidota bacterium]
MLPTLKRRVSLPSVFDEFFGSDMMNSINFEDRHPAYVPAVNVLENGDRFAIELMAPGREKGDFDLHLEDDVLTISSEKEYQHDEEKDGTFMRREFGYSQFKRSFTLPDTADQENIAANYKNGVLHISIPKKEEAKQQPARQIQIS